LVNKIEHRKTKTMVKKYLFDQLQLQTAA